MTKINEHRELAERLGQQVTAAESATYVDLRRAVLAQVSGGSEIPTPRGPLVRQISEAASRVTDGQVVAVRETLGSDKAAFEVVMTAAIGAGLLRWAKAMKALDAAS